MSEEARTTLDHDADLPAPAVTATAFPRAVDRVRNGASPGVEAAALYAALTSDEKLGLLDGDEDFWPAMRSFVEDGYNLTPYVMGSADRLGIPGIRFADGPRGCVVGSSTAFPVSMARGATWDPDLEERVGVAIGREIRAQDGNFFGGVCINLPRHPAWGRAQETYSDQPVLLGAMGAALSRGVQRNAMACMKHFALNSMENGRFTVDVTVDEATLHEVFLPHFRTVAAAGVASVMSAYNSVNGTWAGQNPQLLTRTLREDWGFDGFVISDFIWGLRDAADSLRAGLDIEAPFRQQRGERLRAALDSGRATWADVDRSGRRLIAALLRHHAQTEHPAEVEVAGPEHVALAREAATRAIVLLKNETVTGGARPLLPLEATALTRIAVVGALADRANTGDHGSSDVRPPFVTTPLAGIRAALPGVEVVATGDDLDESARQAAAADVAVVVVGFTAEDEGEFLDGSLALRDDLRATYPEPRNDAERADRVTVEAAFGSGVSMVGAESAGGDRRDLHLKAAHVELIRAVAAANPRTVVVLVNAGAVLVEEWQADVPALVVGWYGGMEAGTALADVLLGHADPSGRMPYPVPASAADLPPLDIDATAITYDRWYGQRLLQRNGVDALFPLGFGLSYTEYAIDTVEVADVDRDTGTARATVTVRNTGGRDGRHVVQVYGSRTDGDRRGERELLGFRSVPLAAGATETVEVALDLTALGVWDAAARRIAVPAGGVVIEASSFWGDSDAAVTEVTL